MIKDRRYKRGKSCKVLPHVTLAVAPKVRDPVGSLNALEMVPCAPESHHEHCQQLESLSRDLWGA